jgi:hypothetical protein
MAHALD